MEWKKILILLLMMAAYMFAGAGVFTVLEHSNEKEACAEAEKSLLDGVAAFWAKNDSGSVTMEDVHEITQIALSAADGNVQLDENWKPSCAYQWRYSNSFFFSGTLVSTIGYGNVSPQTPGGKIFTVFYAFFGIPLFGILLLAVGARIAHRLTNFNARFVNVVGGEKKKAKALWSRTELVIFFASLVTIQIVFLLIPAALLSWVEEWSYPDAVYYTYITLTTIGTGDFVPCYNADIDYHIMYRIFVYLWVVFGLGGMATLINITEQFIKPFRLSESAEDSDGDPDQPRIISIEEVHEDTDDADEGL